MTCATDGREFKTRTKIINIFLGMENNNKIILDLCGGTGSWSKPYKDAGYDVRLLTLPENDIRIFELPKEKIHGILAAPPCTKFCRMRMCQGRPTDEALKEVKNLTIPVVSNRRELLIAFAESVIDFQNNGMTAEELVSDYESNL